MDGLTTGRKLDLLKSKLLKLTESWQAKLGLKWFRIDRVFIYDSDEECPMSAATAECHWQYRQGKITFYLPCILGDDDEAIERTVVHELAHFLVCPLQDYSTDESRARTELAVSLVTDAILGSKH